MESQKLANKNIFMTCEWKDLIISTYDVQKSILEHYLPPNTELDLYEGKALMSIVAFTFAKVNFFGIKIPCHQKFGQINFRFYAKSKLDGTKGVVFIKEFAPKPLIALTANLGYNEPYFYKNIKMAISSSGEQKSIKYSYKNKYISAEVSCNKESLKPETLEEFVVDRYVAFVKNHHSQTLQYKIHHRPWKIYKTIHSEINERIRFLLPEKFKKMNLLKTYVVDGSSVSVEKGILKPE